MPGLKTVVYKEPQLPREVLEKFRKFRETGKFCDVTLIVNNEEFQAHKLVLAASSPYFESVLKSHRVTTETVRVPISTNFNLRAFQSVLLYFYTGSLLIEEQTALEILQIANLLLLFRMKAYLADVLIGSISTDNVFSYRDTAIKLFIPDLHQASCTFIENHFDALKSKIINFELHKFEELLQDHRLNIPRDSTLALLILAWVCAKFESRVKVFRLLLTFVEWNEKIVEQVVSIVARKPQASDLLPLILNAYNEAKSNKSTPPAKFDPIATRMQLESMAVNAAIDSLVRTNGEELPADKGSLEVDDDEEENSDEDGIVGKERVITLEELGGETDESDDEIATTSADKSSSAQVIQCKKCTFVAKGNKRSTIIENHFVRAHRKPITYKCLLCGFVCSWRKLYFDHLKSIHFPKSPPYRCDICDVKSEKIATLVRHRRKHISDRPFSCDMCSYRCRYNAQMLEHSRSHNIERPFTCNKCRKSFPVKIALDAHSKTHQGERYLNCDHCSFRTRYQHHLAMHRLIHLSNAIRCPQGCGFRSGSCTEMEKHIRSHPPERTHLCQICGKTFLDKTHLARHVRSHNSRNHRCSECGFTTSRKDYFSDHLLKLHGIDIKQGQVTAVAAVTAMAGSNKGSAVAQGEVSTVRQGHD